MAGGGWVAVLNTLNLAMQLRSPEAILGRCLSLYQALTFGGMALGTYATGLLADLIGMERAIELSALCLAATLALRWLAPMPSRDEGRVGAT